MVTQPLHYMAMVETLRLHGGLLNLPQPSHKKWGTNITKWIKLGLDTTFIEHIATMEGQKWNASRRAKAKSLEWEFGMERQWREKMEIIFQDMKSDIIFGISGSQEWEKVLMQCYELGFNVAFVEEIEHRQKPQHIWTPTIRGRAKVLEWEFHRPLLIAKYAEGNGKSTATIVKEMIEEKGIKLSPDTLDRRLSQWAVRKRTKPNAYSRITETNASQPNSTCSASTLVDGLTNSSELLANTWSPTLSMQSPFLDLTGAKDFLNDYEAINYDTVMDHPVNNTENITTTDHDNHGISTEGSPEIHQHRDESQVALGNEFNDFRPWEQWTPCRSYPKSDPTRLGIPAKSERPINVYDLHAAITAKETELVEIQSNYSAVVGELNGLRSQADLMSFHPGDSLLSANTRGATEQVVLIGAQFETSIRRAPEGYRLGQ